MFTRKLTIKPETRPVYVPKSEDLPDTALAAIMPYKRQKDVNDFISYVLDALERNAHWINHLVGRQSSFKCAIMIGAGPNRFQIHQMIYPNKDEKFKFEIECRDSEDFDKFAIAALVKLNNVDVDRILKYVKTRFFEHTIMKEELMNGKALGINYAILRPLYGNDKQYRLIERIVIGSTTKCMAPLKRRITDKTSSKNPLKKLKKEIVL